MHVRTIGITNVLANTSYCFCVTVIDNIHLLTWYKGNSTFTVPKVPTIVQGNSEDNSWYRGDNKSDFTRISSL